jgi:hypothetical protein
MRRVPPSEFRKQSRTFMAEYSKKRLTVLAFLPHLRELLNSTNLLSPFAMGSFVLTLEASESCVSIPIEITAVALNSSSGLRDAGEIITRVSSEKELRRTSPSVLVHRFLSRLSIVELGIPATNMVKFVDYARRKLRSFAGKEEDTNATEETGRDGFKFTIFLAGVLVALLVGGLAVFAIQYYTATIPTRILVNAPEGMSITPSSLSLVMDNGSSVSTNLQITNIGSNTLTISAVAIYGDINATYFSASLNDSGTQIPPHHTVNSMLTINSDPDTPAGYYNGDINITASGP